MAYFPGDIREIVVSQFEGSAQAADPYTIDIAHGLYSQNTDFIISEGLVQCASRRGSSQIAQMPNTDGPSSSLFQWYFSNSGTQNCYAVYYSSAQGAKAWNQAGAAFLTLVSVTGAAYMSFATDGIRSLLAFGNSTGRIGTSPGYVYNAANANSDQLFAPPLSGTQISIAVNTTAGAGVVTAGLHRVGVIPTTRNGFTGPLSPASIVSGVTTFLPAFGTALDGAHSWTVSVTFASIPSWMTPGGKIQVCMSSAANTSRYFAVANATANVPNSPGTVNITVNIADGDLVTGTDVTAYQNILTQDLSLNPPFKPSAVFTYSNRAGYVTVDSAGFPVVYFSQQNAYQSMNAGTAGIYLEGRQIPVQGTSIGAVCYIATLSGLYSCTDNGSDPTTWTPPARVDGSVGILAPSCMFTSAGAAGKIVIASEKGLFSYRGGAFPSIPVSFWQSPDWNRINWAAPTQVQVVDDAFDRVMRVLAPLSVVVTGASNTNPITITTAVLVSGSLVAQPHLFQTGITVTIAGVGGNTAANTTQVITVTSANTFTIPVAGNGAYTGGGVATPSTPNAEMTWNYQKGESPEVIMYSLNAFTAYAPGAIGIIRNLTTSQDEVWYVPSQTNPGGMIRRVLPTDTLIHRDVGMGGAAASISTIYETGILPLSADNSSTIHDYHGAHFRATGGGSLAVTAFGLDHVRSIIPLASPFALGTTPGVEVLLKWFLRSAQQSVQVSLNAVDAYFIMALMRVYWTPSVPFQ